MSLTPSNRNNPCPICEATSGKCRQGREDENYWQCMTYADARKGEIVNGFKCIGHTRDKLWGQFKLDNSQSWSEQQRKEWQRENQRRRQEKAKADDERRQRSLSIEQRHEQYTRLLGELTLHPEDRADLTRRGFTHQQIELSGFKSIQRYQQLQSRYSELLPGISRGNRLIIPDEGYLCPVRNADGLIVACQVRLRTLPTIETNRYRWLSGGEQTLHLYPEGGKSEGELPLAVFRKEGESEGVALAEGTGAKPFLVSQRLNLFTIGAAGGQWASSPELFRSTLEKAALEVKGKSIKIFPDAGDIRNPSVMNRWQKVISLLEEWGWSVAIAWWGQVDKSHPDIDELTDYNFIEYISPDKFLAIAGDTTTPSSQGKVTPASTPANINIERSTKEELLRAFPALETEVGEEWLERRKFTPDIVINSRYFDYPVKDGECLAIRSGLGTGKTHYVHNQFLKDGTGAVAIGYRNTLLTQFTERGKEWNHLQTDLKGDRDSLKLIMDKNSRISGCADSLPYFQPQDFEEKALVLDEVEGTMKHLYQSSTAVSLYRQLCKDRTAQAISNAMSSILLDGNLTDATVAHLEALSGKKFLKIKNEFQGNRGKVFFYLGSESTKDTASETKPSKKVSRRDFAWLHRRVMNTPGNFILASDSKEKLEAWERELQAKGKKCFRLDSSNSGTAEAQIFLADPAAYILLNEIEVLLYSPSAESGLSIDLRGYFRYQYFFFFGVVSTNEQTQFMGRLRDPNADIYCYCIPRGIKANADPSQQLAQNGLSESLAEVARLCWNTTKKGTPADDPTFTEKALQLIQEAMDNPHYQYECLLLTAELFEQANLRDCLEYALRDAGYQVLAFTVRAGDEMNDLKEAQEKIRERNAQEIYAVPTPTDKEVQQILKKTTEVTKEEKTKTQKYKLLKHLPGLEHKVITKKTTIQVTKEELREIERGNMEAIKEKLPPTATQVSCSLPPKNQEISMDETQSQQGLEGDPQAAGNYINNKNAACGSDEAREEGLGHPAMLSQDSLETIELEVGEPVFTPELIKKLKFDNRKLLGCLEQYYLLSNPSISHLLQQERWYKRIADGILTAEGTNRKGKTTLNLSTYRSDWLRVKHLLDMGISFFLNPESSWTKDSPELLRFWEKGKGQDRIVRVKWEENPVKYLGKVLESLDVKTVSTRSRADNKLTRLYRINQEHLASPERQALLACIEDRIQERVKNAQENVNWGSLKHQLQQGLEGDPQAASNYINDKNAACGSDEAREGDETLTPIEELVNLFRLCECETDLEEVAKYYEAPNSDGSQRKPEQKEELIEIALLFSPLEMKYRLQGWWNSVLWKVRDFWRLLEQENALSPG